MSIIFFLCLTRYDRIKVKVYCILGGNGYEKDDCRALCGTHPRHRRTGTRLWLRRRGMRTAAASEHGVLLWRQCRLLLRWRLHTDITRCVRKSETRRLWLWTLILSERKTVLLGKSMLSQQNRFYCAIPLATVSSFANSSLKRSRSVSAPQLIRMELAMRSADSPIAART